MTPLITPDQAFADRAAVKKQLQGEYAHFKGLASENAGLALMYMMMVMAPTGLDYQGTSQEVLASEINAIGVLNENLSQVQTDFNNILNVLKTPTNSSTDEQFDADTNKFIDDMQTYYDNLTEFFGPDSAFGKQNPTFYNTVISDFNVFTNSSGEGIMTIFQNGPLTPKERESLFEGLQNEIRTAYQDSVNMNGNGDGGAALKTLTDSFSEVGVAQNQMSTWVSNNLTFVEKENEELQGTLSNMYSDTNKQVAFEVQGQRVN